MQSREIRNCELRVSAREYVFVARNGNAISSSRSKRRFGRIACLWSRRFMGSATKPIIGGEDFF